MIGSAAWNRSYMELLSYSVRGAGSQGQVARPLGVSERSLIVF